MSLGKDLEILSARERMLGAHLAELRVTLAEDRPLARELALVDRRTDAVDDMVGLCEQAIGAAEDARRAAERPVDLPRLGRALVAVEECHLGLVERLWRDAAAFDRVSELRRAARDRGGEWLLWAATVEAALRACMPALHQTGEALLACWRGVVEWSELAAANEQRTDATPR
jgi:hypothetical protein